MRDKIALWLILSLALSLVLFQDFWRNLGHLFSFSYIRATGAYPWAVLGLCLLWLYLKRKEVAAEMSFRLDGPRLTGGAALIALSLLLRNETELSSLALGVLLSSLGVFAALFGGAAMVPGVLLAVYAFAIGFPRVFTKYLETPYSLVTVKTVAGIVKLLGYPINAQGQVFSLTSVSGETLAGYVGAPSAGIASITVFVALFVLMTLDFRPPWQRTLGLFILGIVGTSLQNVLRLVIIILAGYHYGREAMWRVHDYAGYIIFPAWYAVFVFIYFKSFQPRNTNHKKGKRQGI
jgi:exosortase/archaeosortase family protein